MPSARKKPKAKTTRGHDTKRAAKAKPADKSPAKAPAKPAKKVAKRSAGSKKAKRAKS